MARHPDPNLIALGIRQPWAELILRRIKTVEVRTVGTGVRGPIYLYASKRLSDLPAAANAAERYELDLQSLPRGLLVGTVEIEASTPARPEDADPACVPAGVLAGRFAWRLCNAERLAAPLPVRFLPYGIWFYPFRRRGARKGRG